MLDVARARVCGISRKMSAGNKLSIAQQCDYLLLLSDSEAHMLSVLVADDEAGIRRLIRYILEPAYHAMEAVDGHEALVTLHQHRPAIAILDVNMPRLGGLAVCRRIRADRHLAAIRILAMTANGDSDEAAAVSAGADLFVAKPFSPKHLRQLVARLGDLRSDGVAADVPA
jgi:two-component system, OmpR family, response regulator